MADLGFKRTPHDRRLYALEGVGTLRLQGLASRTAIADAGDTSWRIARRGFWQRRIDATDAEGRVVGEFEPRACDAEVRFAGLIASSSAPREQLARVLRARRPRPGARGPRRQGWGRRPVKVTVDDPAAVEQGLLLFATFIVRGLAEDAGSAAAVGATTAATGS